MGMEGKLRFLHRMSTGAVYSMLKGGRMVYAPWDMAWGLRCVIVPQPPQGSLWFFFKESEGSAQMSWSQRL